MGCAASVNVGQQQPGSLVGVIGDGRDAAVLLRKLAAALREGAGFASFGPALRALPAVDAAMLDVLAAGDPVRGLLVVAAEAVIDPQEVLLAVRVLGLPRVFLAPAPLCGDRTGRLPATEFQYACAAPTIPPRT
jgi:hypothetical protein